MVALLVASVLVTPAWGSDHREACAGWPRWQTFARTFLSDDGRVIDFSSADSRTVSEGQAYALLFALAADDRQTFARILSWTEDNLAGGDLALRLPAWHWGRSAQGQWRVLDPNSASDADVWIAYAISEAGRLWKIPRYVRLGRRVARRILHDETAVLPGLGRTLLPAPYGFTIGDDTWRLNPSYMPLPALRLLAADDPGAGWQAVVTSAVAVIRDSADGRFAPDWVSYTAGSGFGPDPVYGMRGSYDAIRVYLWAGVTSADDPARRRVLGSLGGMTAVVRRHGLPPEWVIDGEPANAPGPPGFSAAVLPFLDAVGARALARSQALRVQAQPPPPRAYYQQVLTLLGLGWRDGWIRFGVHGRLLPHWRPSC